MSKMEKGYCINLKNAMIIHRFSENEERDNMCVLFAPISDKVADAIFSGRVKAVDVIAAINNHIRNSPEFNLEKYIEDREKMNVRVATVNLEDLADAEEGDSADAPVPDKADVSIEEIDAARDSRRGNADGANAPAPGQDASGADNPTAHGDAGKRGRGRASSVEDAVDSLI